MNKRLPRLKPDEIIRAVERLGFYLARQSRSHKIYKNKKGMRVTVMNKVILILLNLSLIFGNGSMDL